MSPSHVETVSELASNPANNEKSNDRIGCQLRFKLENDEMKKRLGQAPSAVIVAV
jgi:hypothetical protein